jgi:cytochrome c peroxidase
MHARVNWAWGAAILVGVVGATAAAPGSASGGGSSTEARVELGRRLFFDPAVSRSGDNACAKCHDPEHGFADKAVVSEDEFLPTLRHSQTLIDAAAAPAAHWDGEFRDVDDLVMARLGPPRNADRSSYGMEQTVPIRDDFGESQFVAQSQVTPVKDRIEKDGRYADAFRAAFGSTSVDEARLASAIGAYVRTIRSGESAFDRWQAGDEGAVSADAKKGFELFRGRAGCSECHLVAKSGRSSFSDQQFHNTGVAWNHAMKGTPAWPGATELQPRVVESLADKGRAVRSGNVADEGSFKTPTLRDVASHAPFMHDGSFETLEDVVGYYAKGTTPNPHLDAKIHAFEASPTEQTQIVAFLKSLSSDARPGQAPDLASRAKKTRVRLSDATGKPLAGVEVGLVASGDVLPGDRAESTSDAEVKVVTDKDGWLEFAPGRRTHTKLVLPHGLRAPGGDFVPDTCARLELTLPVRGRAAMVITFPAGEKPPKLLPAKVDDAVMRQAPGTSRRTFFQLDAVTPVGGKPVARYVAWLRADGPDSAVLDVPVGDKRFATPVVLKPGSEQKVDLSE